MCVHMCVLVCVYMCMGVYCVWFLLNSNPVSVYLSPPLSLIQFSRPPSLSPSLCPLSFSLSLSLTLSTHTHCLCACLSLYILCLHSLCQHQDPMECSQTIASNTGRLAPTCPSLRSMWVATPQCSTSRASNLSTPMRLGWQSTPLLEGDLSPASSHHVGQLSICLIASQKIYTHCPLHPFSSFPSLLPLPLSPPVPLIL